MFGFLKKNKSTKIPSDTPVVESQQPEVSTDDNMGVVLPETPELSDEPEVVIEEPVIEESTPVEEVTKNVVDENVSAESISDLESEMEKIV